MLQSLGTLVDIRRDVRDSLRSLRVDPGYSVAVIGALALGLAFSAAVLAVVDGVLFERLPYRDADRLFLVDVRVPAGAGTFLKPGFSAAELDTWVGAVPGVALGAVRHAGRISFDEGINETVFTAAEVDARLFDVLGVRPMQGGFLPEHFTAAAPGVPRPAIVTHDLWQARLGGDPNAIGRRIVTDADRRLSVEIVGVMPPGFSVPAGFDAQLLLAAPPQQRFEHIVARIPEADPEALALHVGQSLQAPEAGPKITVDGLAQRLGVLLQDSEARPTITVEGNHVRIAPPAARTIPERSGASEPSAAPRVRVRPLAQALTEEERPLFWATLCAALALTVAAWLNVSGLRAARSESRLREFAVRRALGAGTPALVRLVLTESVLLAIYGLAVGLLLAAVLLAFMVPVLPSHWRLLRAPTLDWRVFSFAAMSAAACSVMISLLPLRRSLRARTAAPMNAGAHETPRIQLSGRLLVAAEVAFGLALTLAGTLTVASLLRIHSGDLGFESDNVLAVELRLRASVSAHGEAEIAGLVERVRGIPGVLDAGVTDARVLMHNAQGAALRAPAGALPDADVYQHPITAGVLAVMRPRLVAGRIPTAAEFERDGRILVSQRMAKAYWPGRDAVGQVIAGAKGGMYTVAGVVADGRYLAWDFPPMAFAYVPYATFGRSRTPTLLLRTAGGPARWLPDVLTVLEAHRQTFRTVRVRTIDDLLNDTVSHYRFESWLFASFAGASLVLLGVGVLGLVWTTVTRRTREIGVRMALGATRTRVIGLFLTEQLASVGPGLAAGSLIAAWAVPSLRASLYEVAEYDVRLWAVAIALVSLTAVAGALVPILRATRVDPASVLRAE